MTALTEAPGSVEPRLEPRPVAPVAAPGRGAGHPDASSTEFTPEGYGRLVLTWVVITVVGVAIVLANLGRVTEERDQRALLADYRAEIESASNQAFGLAGVEVPAEAPSRGAPVAIVDIEGIDLRRVVVEGTAPQETRQGPGHVLGTAGPGQPGNSVIVGRRSLFGGAFSGLGEVEKGDRILVSTTQGQTVYVVAHVATHEIVDAVEDDPEAEEATTSTTISVVDTSAAEAAAAGEELEAVAAGEEELVLADGPVTVEQLYGPSVDDRLTLVTSASGAPWAAGDAQVVVARLDGAPFAPTPQGGRTSEDDGRSGDPGAVAPLGLALLTYVAAVAGTVWLHRNLPWRSAYLLTAPILLALTIVIAEQIAMSLPAWS